MPKKEGKPFWHSFTAAGKMEAAQQRLIDATLNSRPGFKTSLDDGKNGGVPALAFYIDAKDAGVQEEIIRKLQERCGSCPVKSQGLCSGVGEHMWGSMMDSWATPYAVAFLNRSVIERVRKSAFHIEDEIKDQVRSEAKCKPPKSIRD